MITHIWSMNFTDAATEAQRTAFTAAMLALPKLISGVASFRAGRDLGLNPGNNYDVSIVAEFADEASWKAYIEAPAHQAFINEHVTPLCAKWGAIQFSA